MNALQSKSGVDRDDVVTSHEDAAGVNAVTVAVAAATLWRSQYLEALKIFYPGTAASALHYRHLRADRDAVVEINNVLVEQANAAA
jgi:hypothetical protein